MKPNIITLPVIAGLLICSTVNAQNTFPAIGRAGINTTSPAASLQVRGGARIGTTTNYTNIDSATGNLSFVGSSAYRVAGNSYAFQYAGNPNYGLYFNQSGLQYEFRTSSALPVFSIGANNGNGVFTGGVQVGNSTNSVAGNIRWTGTDFQGYNGSAWRSLTTGTTYTAGTGISIAGNTITNAAPDKIVTIGPAQNMTVTGAYPNYALSFVSPPWFTNGNTGTDSSINFIGTSDAHPLAFRVNNQKSGWVDYTSNNNTSFGYQGLLANTTGFNNTAIGHSTLKANIIGGRNTAIGAYTLVANNADNNTAVGVYALSSNTSGINNTGTGVNALQANTTGNANAAYGVNALYSNTTGIENTASGYGALFQNVTGNDNAAFGKYALYNNNANNNSAYGFNAMFFNTTGVNNTATGSLALQNNTTSSNNTANGYAALYSNNGGNNNSAYGYQALYQNITGRSNVAIGIFSLYNSTNASNLVAVGDSALFNQRDVFGGEFPVNGNNTGVGSKSLFGNTYGQSNTAVGSNSLYNTGSSTLAHADNNTAIGFQSLISNIFGSANTAVGSGADANNTSYSFSTALGYGTIITASNQVRVGSIGTFNDPTSIGGKVGWSTLSDGRVKKNIKQNVPGLAFINKLNPVTYNLDMDAADKIIQHTSTKNVQNKNAQPSAEESAARKAQEKILYTGFVAQDVEKAAKSLNYNFSGVDAAKNDKDLYGLRYGDFVVPLVKAVQELSAQNDELKKENEAQQKINADLQDRLSKLEEMVSLQESVSKTMISLTSASLEQNIPNPFTNTTVINYKLPQSIASAQIVITDKAGKTLKTINISSGGKGSLSVDASTLASGAYQYSLIANGTLIATKQMILAK